MKDKNIHCELSDKTGAAADVCMQMQVVDSAKSDMEYPCPNCTKI